MTVCAECGSEDNIDRHHTSYQPEKTIPLCRSCHQYVHAQESHRLKPNDSSATTTIQITQEQRAKLEELKVAPRESHKAVMDRLLNGKVDDHTVELGELQEQLDRIESATKEATNAAQSADRKLENMGGR